MTVVVVAAVFVCCACYVGIRDAAVVAVGVVGGVVVTG